MTLPTTPEAAAQLHFDILTAQDSIVEVRAFVGARARRAYTDTADAFAAAVRDADAAGASGIFVTVNPPRPDLLARSPNRLTPAPKGGTTSDDEITRRLFLVVDSDAVRSPGASATDGEKAAAVAIARAVAAWLRTGGWPEPIALDSGNGVHLYYPLDLPADDGGLVARVLRALSARFSNEHAHVDTAVGNAARIMKVAGTWARKGDDTPERPHRRAAFLSVPAWATAPFDARPFVTRRMLETVAPPEPTNAERGVERSTRHTAGNDARTALRYIAALGRPARDLWRDVSWATIDVCAGDRAEATALLVEAFGEEEPGEYDRLFSTTPREITSGTLFHHAREAGMQLGMRSEQRGEAQDEGASEDGGVSGDDAEEVGKTSRRSAASVLVDLMAECAELWHDREGEAYITIETPEGARPHFPLRTKNARRLMQRAFFVAEGRTPGGQATEDALGVLEGKAIWEGPEYRTAVRVAETEVEGQPRLYLDLGDETGRVVETYPGGWHVVPAEACPVRFVRRPGSLPLPDPVTGGDIGELRQFVNATPSAFVLLVSWLLMALRARGPFPVLGLTGEQGTGKSTAARMVRSLVDPNVAALRALPRNEREAFISASAAHVMVYDNVSTIYPNVSDVLCRIATGGGYSVRALYADADEQIFDTTNPQILTGIGDVVTRPDLAERTLAVTLERIPDAERTTEAALDLNFDAARPRILGALLDAAAEGLRLLPSIRPDGLPRMADFARFALACEAGGTLGFAPGSFLAAYDGARAELVEAALDSDPVAALVRALRDEAGTAPGGNVFRGTSAQLLDRLVLLYRKDDDKKRLPTGWPASPRALSSALTRCAPPLRAVGIDCERTKEGRDRSRLWVLRYTGQEQARLQPSAPSATVRCIVENGTHGHTGADSDADGHTVRNRPHAEPDRPQPSATVRTPSAENPPWEPVEADTDGADGADGLPQAPSGLGDGLNGSVPVLLLAGDFVGTPAGRGVVTAVHSDGSASVDVGGLVHSLPLSTLTADPYGAPPF